jgi:mono/diheme cytochrome c family protein
MMTPMPIVRMTGVTLAAAALAMLTPMAAQRTYTLPPETVVYEESSLPGYQLVQRNCIGCHSAHYVQTQPPALARTYWENTVKRMKKPFGAQFPDEDIAAMVDYLVKTYGAERPPVR